METTTPTTEQPTTGDQRIDGSAWLAGMVESLGCHADELLADLAAEADRPDSDVLFDETVLGAYRRGLIRGRTKTLRIIRSMSSGIGKLPGDHLSDRDVVEVCLDFVREIRSRLNYTPSPDDQTVLQRAAMLGERNGLTQECSEALKMLSMFLAEASGPAVERDDGGAHRTMTARAFRSFMASHKVIDAPIIGVGPDLNR